MPTFKLALPISPDGSIDAGALNGVLLQAIHAGAAVGIALVRVARERGLDANSVLQEASLATQWIIEAARDE